MKTLVCGIDETGRGPVFGPMVLACVVLDDKGRTSLRKLNVRDSKKVLPKRREALSPIIKEYAVEWRMLKVSAREIDRLRKKMSLNVIEALKISELIYSLEKRPGKVIVDSADTVPENFRKKIIEFLSDRDFSIPEIVAEHRADDNHIEVSCASIIAKVERDREIMALKKTYGEIGSGYPADELTQRFLRELMSSGGELPDFVRRSWSTLGARKQMRLGDF